MEELLKIWQEDEKYGCQQVFTKEQLKELHLVGPFEYAIESRPGTSFGGRCTGEMVCDAQDPAQKLSVSAHGAVLGVSLPWAQGRAMKELLK